MEKKNIRITHQEGFAIGIEGQIIGKCCGQWCLDCDFIRRNIDMKKLREEIYGKEENERLHTK